jgi:cytochrome c553
MLCWARLMLLTGSLLAHAAVLAQATSSDWPDWAYGYLTPLGDDSPVSPPCPADARPFDCRRPSEPDPDDGIKRRLPGSDLSFTGAEANANFAPADWYPGDHPPMPEVVALGKESAGLRACGLCHYTNGQGKMDNAHVAGLPVNYILQQLEVFARGDRHSADPRKDNTNEMARIASNLTEAEKHEVAEYFASMPFRPWVRVVETAEVPQVGASGGLMIPLDDLPPVPIGQRIVEIPEQPERTVVMRDPRSGFVTYVPIGSLAKGEALVTTGAGRTLQCSLCHGPALTGVGDIPSIAGRTASYMMRQLWDVQQGTRKSPIMGPVVQNLSAEDMQNIVAYLASLPP